MACCFTKRSFKRDEVSPANIQPKEMITAANGVTPKADAKARETTPTMQEETKPTSQYDTAALPLQIPPVEVQRVADGEGNLVTLGKLLHTWTAPWPSLPQQITRAQYFTFHDSDVILLGYPKSGSHWMWEMIFMLLKGKAEHTRTPKERLMFTFSNQEFFDTLEPPRIFNCHAPFAGLPVALRSGQNKCKMIYILRNPKDIAVSFYHHIKSQADFDYDGSFHGFVDLFLEGKLPGGSWFDYVLDWEETFKNNPHLPALVLYYEDIKEDTLSALVRVNEFLGLGRDRALLQQVADECCIAKMKKVDEELKVEYPEHSTVSKTGKKFMYRKGEVGDWKNWFSVADNERFQREVDAKLSSSKLHFRYELDEVESTQL